MAVDRQLMLDMLRVMVRIRKFEEQIWNVYSQGLMHGLAHLYIGEEAVAGGVCSALRDDDYITSTHRGHGHCIAKGGKVDRMMAEVMGREGGYCRGKGGSMHIADMSLGILGANGIVGGGFGIATGAAFSARYRKTDQVAACFFGDGGANQGIFFEVMNYAGIWKLPVIFVCENNHYGEYTAFEKVTAGGAISERAKPFGIPARVADGSDVVAVYEATAEAVQRARSGQGPSMIECDTYRYRGHHVGDPGTAYRSKEEIDEWMRKDPIGRLKGRMLSEQQATEAELKGIEDEVQKEVLDGLAWAKASPWPDVKEVGEHVYA